MTAWLTYTSMGKDEKYQELGRETVRRLHSFGIETALCGDWLSIDVDNYTSFPKSFPYYASSKLFAMDRLRPEKDDFLIDLDLWLEEPPRFDGNTVLEHFSPGWGWPAEAPVLAELFPVVPKIQYITAIVKLDDPKLWKRYKEGLIKMYARAPEHGVFIEQHSLPLICECNELKSAYIHVGKPPKHLINKCYRFGE